MKKIQENIKEFCEEHGLTGEAEHRVLDLVSEVGEFSKEVLKTTDYGSKSREMRDEVKDELGDVLFSLVTVANELGVDLKESLDKALEKYKKRAEKNIKNNIGSS